MIKRRILVSALTGAAGAFVASIATTPAAYAQSTTTGAIQGIVKDKATGEPLPGVAVVANGAQGQGAPSALTDENGFYKIDGLTPGRYIVKYFFATVTVTRDDITVGVNKTVPVYIDIDTENAGEKVVITGSAPTIDPTSTTQGITLDQEYTKNIPVPGRTFESALGAAAGSQGDGVGVSFSGSSSLENQYFVDGINTTGLTLGTVGSPVINDFIQEIEVITGGYDAEYGRATGGVVNVVTKSGTNDIKGSVFSY
ncbi:MAG TPA: carboxypeptidase regulatory-like domain-containing protein, partial [Kofleriaceae bacterium]|nr:carboxypeptidase regulatory-like domain-containing protein [Kofleriaceae bacterium]